MYERIASTHSGGARNDSKERQMATETVVREKKGQMTWRAEREETCRESFFR